MVNFKKYAVVVDSINNRVQICETVKGEWVKFADVKEFLKPTTNSASAPCYSFAKGKPCQLMVMDMCSVRPCQVTAQRT